MKLKVLTQQPQAQQEQPWYADGLAFSCTCSGNCCTGGPGFVWLEDWEVDKLAEHLRLSRDETIEKYCRRVGRKFSLKETRTPQGNYDCIFLTELAADKKTTAGGDVPLRKRVCGIYPVRPLQCRTWPFWDGNLASRENWERSAKRCPGMNRGRRFAKEEIEALRDATDWPDRPPTSEGTRRKSRK
jgi:Fe-S-cluster containining protein